MRDYSPVERIIRAARAATRCRQAALESPEAAEALLRAADRFSWGIAQLADEIAKAGAPR